MKQTVNELSDVPISDGVISGNTLYVSGQVGMDFEVGKMMNESIEQEVAQVLSNLEGVLIASGSDKSLVLKTTVFLTDLKDYDAMNAVYKKFFGKGFPARSCIQVAKLPLDARVEIECVAELA